MAKPEYHFSTLWHLDAPLQQVWEAIYHPEHWPHWWKGVEQVSELEPGDDSGLGALQRYTWKGALPYRLTFDMRVTRIEPLITLEGVASGEVEGTGCWRFWREGVTTIVLYEWHVSTTKRWMQLLDPVARPLFKWNHDVVMDQGGLGLAHMLNARLLAVEHQHQA
jgi:hypothetical protein